MDRRRRPAALALVFALASLAASDAPPLAEMRWLAEGTDVVAALGWQPAECLVGETALQARGQILDIEIGRAAFRSPLTLGGQAARAGISCESCHRNGRTNPSFHFPGVSGAPGTADVTSSLFSSQRGNGVVDPRPIPDLGAPRDQLKVVPHPDQLPAFIHGLVVEEFDGPEPTPAVLAGLAAYVRAIRPEICGDRPVPVTGPGYLLDAIRAADVGAVVLADGDRQTALVMFAAARTRLGRIDERYAGLAKSQALLRKSSADLAAVEAMVRAGDPWAMERLEDWRAGTSDLVRVLMRDEPRSLFNHKRLAASARLLRGGR